MSVTLWHLPHRWMKAAPGLFHQLILGLIPWLHLPEYSQLQLAESRVLILWYLNPQITLLSSTGLETAWDASHKPSNTSREVSATPYGESLSNSACFTLTRAPWWGEEYCPGTTFREWTSKDRSPFSKEVAETLQHTQSKWINFIVCHANIPLKMLLHVDSMVKLQVEW